VAAASPVAAASSPRQLLGGVSGALGGREGGGRADRDVSGGHIDHPKTAETIAAEHGVSERTVRRAAELVERLPPDIDGRNA